MSLDYSVGDLIAVTKLAWKLYETLKECPQEIKDLGRDLATMYGVLSHIQDDLESNESAIGAHGEGRIKMLDSMVKNLMATLNEIEKVVNKFRPLAAESKLSMQQVQIKWKWVVGQKKIKKIHQDVSLHISAFNLLLTSMGNSSLQRIESGLEDMRLSSLEREQSGQQQSRKRKSPPSQQASSEDEGSEEEAQVEKSVSPDLTQTSTYGRSRSLIAAVPVLDIPTKEIETLLGKITPSQHVEVAEIIAVNCRIAAFEFYHENALWHTKFNTADEPSDPKLFQLADGGFPQSPDDLELRSWIRKIQHASGPRLGEPDAVSTAAIRPDKEGYSLYGAMNIFGMLYPWGLLNALEFEASLCFAISLCRQLYAWDCAARLETLWSNFHPSVVDEDWKLNLDRAKVPVTNPMPIASGQQHEEDSKDRPSPRLRNQ